MILFLSGTINWKLAHSGKEHYPYDFNLLSGAAGLIYGYTGVIPIGLWATLKWFGSESANLLECWALYGYANLVWIPVAIISWSPITALNWIFVGIGFGLSALFLFRNLLVLPEALFHKNLTNKDYQVSCSQCNRRANVEDPPRRCRGFARWLCNCN